MDLLGQAWEHKIYYKFEGNAPDYISRDLRECAEMVSSLDEKMLSLNEAIQKCLERSEAENEKARKKHISHGERQAAWRLSDKPGAFFADVQMGTYTFCKSVRPHLQYRVSLIVNQGVPG